ncbi:MAG: hypothetical protein E4H09_02630, partial [Spirochaetales bacterium]
YMHRPGSHTPPQPRPEAFWWRGPDGSKVLVRNDMRRGYNGEIGPSMVSGCLQPFVTETGLPCSLFQYGVGDHGGGPTRRDLERLTEMQGWPVYPSLVSATNHDFFRRLEKEGSGLPVIDGELNMEFTGCYTSQSLIKKANRSAGRRLVEAETAATLGWLVGGQEYPAGPLTTAWQDTLFSHFHDILPGSCVRDSRTYAHGLYQQAMARTSSAQTTALRGLAGIVDTSSLEGSSPGPEVTSSDRALGAGAGYGSADGSLSAYSYSTNSSQRILLVYNPLPVRREEILETAVWDTGHGWDGVDQEDIAFQVTPPGDEPVRAQVIGAGDYWGHRFVTLAFPVSLPPMGYAVYEVTEGEMAPAESRTVQLGSTVECFYSQYERSTEGIENDLIRLEINTRTGGILRLVDKATGADIVSPDAQANALEYGYERTGPMSAWIIQPTGGWSGARVLNITRGTDGPFKATLKVELKVEDSEFTLTYEVRAGDDAVYLHITGLWREYWTQEKGGPALRFSLPLNAATLAPRYETPFGAIDRTLENGEEVPALRWAAVTGTNSAGGATGCLLINDSKHGHSVLGNRLNLTLIRSSHDPDPLPEVGPHEIHLSITPLSAPVVTQHAIAAADRFDHAPCVVSTGLHSGTLPLSASFVELSGEGVVMTSFKKAEKGEDLILRLMNPTASDQECRVIFGAPLKSSLVSVDLADVLEEAVESAEGFTDGRVTVTVPAYGFVTLRIHR